MPLKSGLTAVTAMRFAVVLLALLLVPSAAWAWWNPDWAFRKKITLNTSDSGAATRENVAQAVVPLRLHTGNFIFADAKEDGSDLRVVSGDDKTPLKHHVESWDAANEIAIVWVQVPRVTGGSGAEFVWLYFGNKKANRAEDTKGSYDASHTLVLHLSERQGSPSDATGYAQNVRESSAALGAAGLLGGAAGFDGTKRIVVAGSSTLKLAAGGAFTFSAWVRAADAQSAVLYSQQDGPRSLVVGLDGSIPYVRLAGAGAGAEARGKAQLAPAGWHHVVATLGGGRLVLYVDGTEAGAAAAQTPELGGDVVLGAGASGSGFKGELDEIQLASVARSPDWVKLAHAGQVQEGKLLAYGEDEQTGGTGHSYFGILVDNLTVDAWVVIVILMFMLVVSFVVMLLKALFLVRTERANQAFLERFEKLSGDLTSLDPADHADHAGGIPNGVPAEQKLRTEFAHSSLFRVYHLGVRELRGRLALYRQKGLAESLTPQAVNSIRASMDAGIVRENARLNSQMVLLTIAISGGPFLGLLGTVVGVMITFAAIAAAGDVNVNAIAPGIAAALLATVAGLAVAIPALFGYNWLASRIKGISAEMQVFADELLTKFAEAYSA